MLNYRRFERVESNQKTAEFRACGRFIPSRAQARSARIGTIEIRRISGASLRPHTCRQRRGSVDASAGRKSTAGKKKGPANGALQEIDTIEREKGEIDRLIR